MTIGQLLPYPRFKGESSTGVALSGGKLYTYEPGTTTPKATYTTYDLSVANTNPVILDANGEAVVYTEGTYKLVLKDASDVVQWTMDNIRGWWDAPNDGFYYPDYAATDQGVTGDSNTIKYYIDLIGSDIGTIVLQHNSGNPTTEYTLTTSETVPNNITIKKDSGAFLDGAGTLTFSGGLNFDSSNDKAFGTSITVSGLVTGKAVWWGFETGASAGVNDAAMAAAMAACQNVFETRSGTFFTSAPIEFTTSQQTILMAPSTFISYSGTDFALKYEGVNRCILLGNPIIITTNLSGSGISFQPSGSAACNNNSANITTLSGKGGPSTAAFAASGTVGVLFGRATAFTCYFNRVYGTAGSRIAGYNTNVLFDAPGGNPASGPSGSATFNIDHDDYWFGYRFEGAECMVYGGFANSSAGDAGNNTTFLHFSNNSLFNTINGVTGEPGSFAIPYNLTAGSNNNMVDGNFSNFTLAGTNAGTDNWIKTGRNAYYPHITFPVTQSASTDPNTLDDYEEGTFTITLEFGGASVGVVYDVRAGMYTKVGNVVTVTGNLNLSSKGSSVGDAVLTGLPFTVKNVNSGSSPVNIDIELITFADSPQAIIFQNTDSIVLTEVSNGGTRTTLTNDNFGNDSRIFFSGTYFTD